MLYQKQVENDDVAEPIPDELDADLMAMRVGKRLGISTLAVSRTPLHYVSSAMIAMDAERLEHERQAKRMEQRRKSAAAKRPARRRR